VACPVERCARIVEVHPVKRGGEAVGVALAPDLAVGDDVDPGSFHVSNRNDRRVVLRLLQVLGLGSPDLERAGARGETAPEHSPIHEPVGLRVAADDGCR
jgi:hypothetical protein